MPFQLSPGVAVVEKDFSSIVPAVSSSAGAFAGPFAWGPIEDPVRVSSETDLVTRFGKPRDENYQSFFTAANFLSYTNSLYVARTDALGLKNAVAIPSGSVSASNIVITQQGVGYVQGTHAIVPTFSDPDIAGGTRATATAVTTTEVISGTTYVKLQSLTITNPGSGYTQPPTITFSQPGAGGTVAAATVTQLTVGGVKIKNVSDYLSGFVNGAASYGPWAAKFAGTKGNKLRIVMLDAGSWSGAATSIKANFAGAPATSSFAEARGLLHDEVHVLVLDNDKGDFSGIPNSVLESYSFLSKLSDAKRADGSNNYYKSVINAQSKYVWWLDHETEVSEFAGTIVPVGSTVGFSGNNITITTTTDNWAQLGAFKAFFDAASDKTTRKLKVTGANAGSYTVSSVTVNLAVDQSVASYVIAVAETLQTVAPAISTSAITSVTKHTWGQSSEVISTADTNYLQVLQTSSDHVLTGGANDFASSDANIIAGYALFANSDQFDISLVPVGNVSPTTAQSIVNTLAEVRKDCVVFISPRNISNGTDHWITSSGSNATDAIIAYRDATNLNTSYAVIDSGWKYQYDRYNDAYRWVPLNGDIAGLCARTDYSADPWFSPGGFNRGQIKNIVKLGFNPSQADRDVLYPVGVNPVVTFPGQGTVLYGDKTMLRKPSAFDRINVRRLFIVLEKSIAVAAKYQMFEFNDSFTRAQFKNLVEPFLRDVQGRRGVVDFRVKCDETNNTGEVIDRNEFVADIFIKPNRSINYITLNFVAARSSVSFEEIGG